MTDIATHIHNVDGNWGTSQFNRAHLSQAISSLQFVAHPNPDNTGSDGQPPTNHWSLFLTIDARHSVEVDSVPGDNHSESSVIDSASDSNTTPNMVILESMDPAFANEKIHVVSSLVPAGTTVASILRVIIDHSRDDYVSAPIGEGCRH